MSEPDMDEVCANCGLTYGDHAGFQCMSWKRELLKTSFKGPVEVELESLRTRLADAERERDELRSKLRQTHEQIYSPSGEPWWLVAKTAKLDGERLDWKEKHPAVQFTHKPARELSAELRAEFPNGYWRRVFGFKDRRNRFQSLRAAIDAARKGQK